MDEKFVNKCFENWKAIVEYIEKQYENLPVSRDFALDFVTKPNERTIIFELTVNTFGAVYLKSNDREDYSDFLNIFKLDDVTKAKCTDMRKKRQLVYSVIVSKLFARIGIRLRRLSRNPKKAITQ